MRSYRVRGQIRRASDSARLGERLLSGPGAPSSPCEERAAGGSNATIFKSTKGEIYGLLDGYAFGYQDARAGGPGSGRDEGDGHYRSKQHAVRAYLPGASRRRLHPLAHELLRQPRQLRDGHVRHEVEGLEAGRKARRALRLQDHARRLRRFRLGDVLGAGGSNSDHACKRGLWIAVLESVISGDGLRFLGQVAYLTSFA